MVMHDYSMEEELAVGRPYARDRRPISEAAFSIGSHIMWAFACFDYRARLACHGTPVSLVNISNGEGKSKQISQSSQIDPGR